ncbi:MAG: hypothetical protein ABR878_07360 [Roseiarcus sp.]|jgi:hypothetical protein
MTESKLGGNILHGGAAVMVTWPKFSTINSLFVKRRPPPLLSATEGPSLWEDGAFDRLIARLA